jgi:hypothetical protein
MECLLGLQNCPDMEQAPNTFTFPRDSHNIWDDCALVCCFQKINDIGCPDAYTRSDEVPPLTTEAVIPDHTSYHTMAQCPKVCMLTIHMRVTAYTNNQIIYSMHKISYIKNSVALRPQVNYTD